MAGSTIYDDLVKGTASSTPASASGTIYDDLVKPAGNAPLNPMGLVEGVPGGNPSLISRGQLNDNVNNMLLVGRSAHAAGFTGKQLQTMIAIGMAESSGKPGSHNNNPKTGDDSYGLFQINRLAHPEFSPQLLSDPIQNAKVAKQLFDKAGGSYRDWSAFKNGSYKKYLKDAKDAATAVEMPANHVARPVTGPTPGRSYAYAGKTVLDMGEAAGLRNKAVEDASHTDPEGDKAAANYVAQRQGKPLPFPEVIPGNPAYKGAVTDPVRKSGVVEISDDITEALGMRLLGLPDGWWTKDPESAKMRQQANFTENLAQWFIPGLKNFAGMEYAQELTQQSIEHGAVDTVKGQAQGAANMFKAVVSPDSSLLDKLLNGAAIAALGHAALHGGKVGVEALKGLRDNPQIITAAAQAGITPDEVVAKVQEKLQARTSPQAGPEATPEDQARNATTPVSRVQASANLEQKPPSSLDVAGQADSLYEPLLTDDPPTKPTRKPRATKEQREQAATDLFGDETPKTGHDTTGLANQVQTTEAERGVISEVEETKGKSADEWQRIGKKAVDSGEDYEALARQVAGGEVELTGERVGTLLEGKRRMLNDIRAAEAELDSKPGDSDALDRLNQARGKLDNYLTDVQAGKGRWSDVGRALQAGTQLDTGDPAAVLAEVRRKVKDAPDDHQAVELSKQLKASQESEAALREELAAARSEAENAKAGTPDRGQPKGKTKKQTIQEQIESHFADLKKLETSGNVGGGTKRGATAKITAEDIANSVERAKVIGRIVHSYAKLGAASLEELIANVQQAFREKFDTDIDRQAIIDAYAQPQVVRTRTEAQKQVAALKAESKGASTARLSEINETIADLQKQLKDRSFREETPRERKATEAILDAQAKQRKLKAAVKASIDRAGVSPGRRLAKVITDVPRALALTGHGTVGMFSHSGRNWFRPSYMEAQARSTIDSIKMTFKKTTHEQLMQGLENDPEYGFMLRSQLAVGPRVVDDAALVNESLGKIGEFGNRGMDALQLMRARLWKQEAPKFLEGLTGTEKLDAGKALADMINHATGKAKGPGGPVGKLMLAPSLEAARWTPFKDTAATIDTLAFKRGKATPAEMRVAKLRVKRAAELAGTYMTFLAVNKYLLGQNVNLTDPTKSDWMKFKIGDKAIDATGNIFAPARLLLGLATVAINGPTRKDQSFRQAMYEQAGRYAEGKLHPGAEIAIDAAAGQDFIGRPLPWSSEKAKDTGAARGKEAISWTEYLLGRGPIPVGGAAREVYDDMRKNAGEDTAKVIMKGAATFGLELTGLRVSDVPTSPKKSKGWDELKRLNYPAHIIRHKDPDTGDFTETGKAYFERKTKFEDALGKAIEARMASDDDVDKVEGKWSSLSAKQRKIEAEFIAKRIRKAMGETEAESVSEVGSDATASP